MPDEEREWPAGTPRTLIRKLTESPGEVIEFIASKGYDVSSIASTLDKDPDRRDEFVREAIIRFGDPIGLTPKDVGKEGLKARGGWRVKLDTCKVIGSKTTYSANHYTKPDVVEVQWHDEDGTAPGREFYDIVHREGGDPEPAGPTPESTRWDEII